MQAEESFALGILMLVKALVRIVGIASAQVAQVRLNLKQVK